MTQIRPFAQVDVFSAAPFQGNPLAVVLEADGLDEKQMQQIASWTNLSETTFLFAPTNPDADYRVRIFTPRGELPFAGHPTLGSAHAWVEHGGVPVHSGRIIQECAAGLIEIRQMQDLLYFAAPPTIRSGDIEPEYLQQLISALGVHPEQVLAHQWVDNGPGWAAIQLATAEEVLALKPDFREVPDAKIGVIGFYPDGAEHTYEIRAFVPGLGVGEDPVTGSLNASVAQWFIRRGEVPQRYTASQGRRIGRLGEIHIIQDAETVWVGGKATTLFRGTAQT